MNQGSTTGTNRKRLLYTAAAVYAGCLLLTALIMRLEHNLSVYNPLHTFFRDFDFTDYYYKINEKELAQHKVNNIVIVNGNGATKTKICELINSINAAGAEVIALDYWFAKARKDSTDQMNTAKLEQAIKNTHNLVIGYELPEEGSAEADDQLIPGTGLQKRDNETGFVNLSDKHSTIRRAPLIMYRNERQYKSLAFAIAEKDLGVNNDALRSLTNNKAGLLVKYLPPNAFATYDAEDLLAQPTEYRDKIKGKIVLVGECDRKGNLYGKTDRHFTPLNEQMGGRSFPDMEGVYVHANIVHNLLGQAYVKEPKTWLILLYTFILCLFLLPAMMIIYVKQHHFFHFGMALIYEPLVFFAQIIFAVLFFSGSPGTYIPFEIPFVIFFTAPFAIYLLDFLDIALDRLIRRLSKGKHGSPSYFSAYRAAHFHRNTQSA